MKRTLKRELKVLEIVNREPLKMWENSTKMQHSSQGEWGISW